MFQKTIYKIAVSLLVFLHIISVSFLVTASGQMDYINSSVPILLYHHLAKENPYNNEYILNPDTFYEHLLFLKNNGYECISLNDYYNYRMGLCTLPPKPIIITFDDGYYSNYQYAYPMLKKFNMKATIFISTALTEDDSHTDLSYFSWEEAKEMEESGLIDIQSHSHNHVNLLQLDASEILQELTLSKNLIEKNLNKTCNYFAYPGGMCNAKTKNLAKRAGYLMQFTTNSGFNTDKQLLNELCRFTILNDTSATMLSEILSPFQLELTTTHKNIGNNQMSVEIDFNIMNNIKKTGDAVVILAIYDEKDRLIYLNSRNIFLEKHKYSGAFSKIILPDNPNFNSYTAKLFCLDRFSNLVPYSPAISQLLK